MPGSLQARRLKKELGLLDVYVIAIGGTLSSGFFLLPGIAAVGAGPALPLSYLIAALFLVPGLISKAELATALPRSGGVYFFLDRSMGPMWGTITGFGTWSGLILKTAFALLGIGAYLGIFFPSAPMVPIAAAIAVAFGVVNMIGAKKSGTAQVVLVIGLLLLLLWFAGVGALQIQAEFFRGFLGKGASSIVSTAGLVVVSYMGISKVASVAEEVKDPVRNLPLGMFLAFGTTLVIYLIGTTIMVGVVSADALAVNGGDLTPVATVAEALAGRWGAILMTIAAVLAFSSVANAGILSGSRYPFAMGRDKLIPEIFETTGKKSQTPQMAIALTVGLIVLSVIFLSPTLVAKLASSVKLLMFAMSCFAVIILRESRIDAYDPGFRSPFYPWLQLLGIAAPLWLVTQLGLLSMAFAGGLTLFGAAWYWYYARKRVDRRGAIFHVFERLGRGSRDREQTVQDSKRKSAPWAENPFAAVVERSLVIDADAGVSFEDVTRQAAELLTKLISVPADVIEGRFLEVTRYGATPVIKGVALPHFCAPPIRQSEMVLVRSQAGIRIGQPGQSPPNVFGPRATADEGKVHAIFFLVSPDRRPGLHLQIMAQIAHAVDRDDFSGEWAAAAGAKELRQLLLRLD